MKIKLIVELESRDDFSLQDWAGAIEMAVAESLPSAVHDEDGNPTVMFSSFSVEVAK